MTTVMLAPPFMTVENAQLFSFKVRISRLFQGDEALGVFRGRVLRGWLLGRCNREAACSCPRVRQHYRAMSNDFMS